MKKVLFSAMALTMGLMMLVSCNKEKKVSKEAVFTANIEQQTGQQGRTSINPENGQVKWLAGDKILVANGEGETATFTLQSGAGSTNGTFRTAGEFEMTEPFVAVYPQTATLSGTTATFNLPATQTLTQTCTFANGANPMAAYGTDENLYFKNLCGGLDVRLLGDNIHVSGIRITGAQGEMLNGTFAVDCSSNEPTLMANQGTNGTNIVTLNCDVTLTSTTTAQEFFIVLPVGALAQGFIMEVLDGENIICTKQVETNLAQIVRHEVKRFNPLLIVNETPTPIELPDVTTAQVTDITTTTATAGGEIISDGGSAITECGVCWSTEGEPTIEGNHATATATTGAFTVSLTGLTQNTTYNIRAYATNEAGTGYGDVLTFTTEEEIIITAPTVTTAEVTEITTTTATVGGAITDAGNGTISEKGICYKTGNEEWTCVALEATENAFSTTLTELTPNTTYTVRAYATNEEGTGYGEEVSFTTLEEIVVTVPTVTTDAVTDITTNSALVGGAITNDGNGTVTESGICYKTGSEEWTCVAIAATNNAFSMTLTGLTANTTYTVRAYATNEEGTGYGEEVSFTTEEEVPTIPEGAINGLFTINANGDQVYFSQGNLQYIGSAATPYWKFADHQWDYFGTAQNGDSQTIDRDLFGWGTSGYNHGANAYQPWCTSEDASDYYAYGVSTNNLYDGNGQADWGYNAISNGGDIEHSGWRTLTKQEWNYVFNTRSTASGIRYAKATVNGVNGVILLPDNWDASMYVLNNNNYAWGGFDNTISAEDWANTLEANGAVFLPAAGACAGTSVVYVGSKGYYWSATYGDDDGASDVFFEAGYLYAYLDFNYRNRSVGESVRLVRFAE
ncbi:MAG: fibronectin type III domain-containing protein [Bacteroidales bacterium]|nr:fibronectin type III domain-containing protein [Bacteroidales bacterium]